MAPPVDPSSLPARMAAMRGLRRLLEVAGEEQGVWLVGGAVRDLLLGEEPLDLDLCVEGETLEVARRLAARLGGEVEATGRFDTATVRAPEVAFDIARARRERYPSPGALPEVAPATLEEDLPRRDFTVNALAAALDAERPGALRAPPGAQEDLRAGLLRVLHPRSFVDDPTRLLRLARFAARPGFPPEAQTGRLAREAIAGGALRTVSGKRIGTELRLLVGKAPPLDALRAADDLGLLAALHPRLELDPPLTAEALELIGDDPQRSLVALASLCLGLARPELRTWLDELAFPAGERDAILTAATDAAQRSRELRRATRPSEIAAAARAFPPAAVALAGAVGAPEQARRWLGDLRHVRLEIGGRDVVAAGVPEGPGVGRALDAALRAKLDGEASGREEELRAALVAS